MSVPYTENELLQKITEIEPEVDRHYQNYTLALDNLVSLRQDLHSLRRDILSQYLDDNFGELFVGYVINESQQGDFTVTFTSQVGGEVNYELLKNSFGSDLSEVSTYSIFNYVGEGVPWLKDV